MAKQYFAIGVDVDGDVVSNSVGESTLQEAVQYLKDEYTGVAVHHIVEIDVLEKPVEKIPVTKLKV